MDQKLIPVIAETTVSASPQEAWAAITEQPQMIKWYFEDIPDFKAEVGFETSFNVHSGGRDFNHLWKVLEVEQERKIAYTWLYEDFEGDGKVIFEVIPVDNGTTIRLTCLGIETFQKGIPEFTREACQGGWNYFISERLNAYLEGNL